MRSNSKRLMSTAMRQIMPVGLFLLLCLSTSIGALAEEIKYKYDSLHRLIEVTYPDRIVTYTYDAAGNRTSTTVQVVNPVPAITLLTPSSASVGSAGFTLRIDGNSLVSGTTVSFNGSVRTTTFFGDYVTIDLTNADLATAGSFSVSVENPAPGGGPSNTLTFSVVQPTLAVNTVSPKAGRASGGQQIQLTGSFAGLSTVTMGGLSASWSYTNGGGDTSSITVTTPAHSVGAVAIVLSPISGSDVSKANAFAYLPTVFTDDTLTVGVTTAKAQHILELRQAVDALRAVAGLTGAPWTDPALAAGQTIRAVHITDLRMFLDGAATALGISTSPYVDPGLASGLVIKRIHIEELRQRIRTIAG